MRFSAALLLFLSVSVVVRAQDCSLLISHPSGWYDAPVSVTMMPSLGCAGAVQIRYTLNSDTPDAGSPQCENALLLEDVSGRPDRFTSIRTTIPDESSFLDRFMPPESDVHKAVILRAAVFSDTLRVTPVYTSATFLPKNPGMGIRYFRLLPIRSTFSVPKLVSMFPATSTTGPISKPPTSLRQALNGNGRRM